MNETTDSVATPTARFFGRLARLVVGGFLVVDAAIIVFRNNTIFFIQMAFAWVALVAFYTLAHWFIANRIPNLNPWIGAAIAVLPVAILYVMGPPAVRIASTSFIGFSLVVDGLLGSAGCEVMSLPGLLLGRRTHLVCIVFSPLDWLESKRTAAR